MGLFGSNPVDLSSLTNFQYFGGYPSSGYDAAGAAQPINIGNTNLDNLSTTDLFGTSYGGDFSGAGGQAATQSPIKTSANTASPSTSGGLLGGAGNALGIAGGLAQGGTSGYGSAALNAAALANKAGLINSAPANTGVGYGANALGIYSGLKQGGIAGDTSAAINAAQLAGRTGALGGASGAVSSAAGYAAIPLSLYNEINNWQSGATGQDALGGAATGAAIGSVVPVVGTALGALIGGAAGAISSAFGNGKVDPENAPFEQFTQAFNKAPAAQQPQIAQSVQNPYLPLAGLFDLRSNQIKGTIPIYNTYGRAGEQKFTNDLISKVQTGSKSGITDPNQMWSQVVNPWLNSMGTWTDSNKAAITGLIQNMTGQIMAGTYQQNFKAIGGDSPFAANTATPIPRQPLSLMDNP